MGVRGKEFIQCCPLVRKSTQNKTKGHRGLPENPVELKEAFNFATGSRSNSALQQAVVYMPMRGPSFQELSEWLPESFYLSCSYLRGKIYSLALILTHHKSLCKERFLSLEPQYRVEILHIVLVQSLPKMLLPSHSPMEGWWD